jgi:hypothetical protein
MTDFRALCADLAYELDAETGYTTNDGVRITHPTVTEARAALAQPEPQGPTDEELWELYDEMGGVPEDSAWCLNYARAVLARWGRPAIEPVPVAERLLGSASERFEFSVFDSEYEEQAGGTAPTYSQALSEGLHYLAVYAQDGPHSLELRRVEVLPHHALPVPQKEAE